MLDNPIRRRMVTVPVVLIGFGAVTILTPALVVAAVSTDLFRSLTRRTPWVAIRMVSFLWVYLLGEVWALIALTVVALGPANRRIEATYRLQDKWAGWNFIALRALFDLRFSVEGSDQIAPGPIIVLSRHASMIDTLVPAMFITRPHGIRLRYVLKKELRVDPALDIAGNRLHNCFIDRAGDTDTERMAIRRLGSGLGRAEGVLIYPEGTRYTEEKRRTYSARLRDRPGRVGEVASGLRKVLPPRPGGTLALLETGGADVVVLAHSGLEGFARVRDLWSGRLIGSTIRIRFRRIPWTSIPSDRSSRVAWLFDVWADIDDWVAGGFHESSAEFE